MIQQTILILISITILLSVITKILHKYVLKETNPYAYALITQIISGIIFIPFVLLSKFSFPNSPKAWIILLVAGILWALVALTIFISYKDTEVSIRDPLSQTRLIWALVLGILFLKESVTSLRVIGTIVIFFGISLLLWHPERKFGRLSDPGIRWTFIAAILSALVAIADKFALRYFDVAIYGLLVYIIPSIVLLFFIKKRTQHVTNLFKKRGFYVILGITFSALTYYFTLRTFAVADVTLVYPLLQLGILLTVISGIIFLKEREHLWQKIISAILVLIGTIIIGK